MSDSVTQAEFQVNIYGERVCEWTGLVDYGCAHCQGLPWGEDPQDG